MIQIYSPGNNKFDSNGNITLLPTSCVVDVILNGNWQLELLHPIDDEGRWKYIVENAVIKAPSFNGEQLFRIKSKIKSDTNIEAIAEPIFMDAKDDCILVDTRPTNKSGKEALDIMMSGSKYKGSSDILKLSTAYYITKNLIEAINGDDENSFINRWGGEIVFDNYNIIINSKAGTDRGIELLYGKNIAQDGFSEEVDMNDIVTSIIPKSFNGHMLSGTNPWVDSPLINKYPTIHRKVIQFDDVKLASDVSGEENGVTICDTIEELRTVLVERCKKEFENGIDKPKVTIKANMVLLQQTTEYKEFKELENVSLGDTIHCKHYKLEVISNARVVELTYDCLREYVSDVTFGCFTYNYFNDVTSVKNAVSNVIDINTGSVLANKIAGIINAAQTQMRYQKDIAKKQDVRAILFEDLDKNSPTYGASCLGSLGFQVANKRTADDKDWIWSTFANANGVVAEMVAAGILLGMKMEAGEITGTSISNGMNFFVDKDGNMQCINGKFSGTVSGSKITGETTIDVGTDLRVGNNIYLNDNDGDYTERSINMGRTTIEFEYAFTGSNELNISTIGKNRKNYVSERMSAYDNGLSAYTINVYGEKNNNSLHMGDTLSTFWNALSVRGDLYVDGSKNRIVKDFYEGNVLMNAVESADPVFEDYGTAQLDENGKCVIRLDKRFLSTVNAKEQYFVFLTSLSEGNLFVKSKYNFAFVVQGTPNLKFDWRVTAKQKGFENNRMDEYKKGGS